jgi:hypothetical protein
MAAGVDVPQTLHQRQFALNLSIADNPPAIRH